MIKEYQEEQKKKTSEIETLKNLKKRRRVYNRKLQIIKIKSK